MAVIYYTFRQHISICGARSLFESSNPPVQHASASPYLQYLYFICSRASSQSPCQFPNASDHTTSPLSLPAVSHHHLSNLIRPLPTRIANSQCSHAARALHIHIRFILISHNSRLISQIISFPKPKTHRNRPFSLP